jgi:hypothetical protein
LWVGRSLVIARQVKVSTHLFIIAAVVAGEASGDGRSSRAFCGLGSSARGGCGAHGLGGGLGLNCKGLTVSARV